MQTLKRFFSIILGLHLLTAQAVLASNGNDEASILKALDSKWTAAINAGNAEEVAQLFAIDGRIFPSGAPEIKGREAIAVYAAGLSQLLNLSFKTEPTTIEVAASGELAYLAGRYSIEFGAPTEKHTDIGKYLVVWKKVEGSWLVAVDTFASDLSK
ncbi:MAG: SgcJ/EcaC family oxidoreductase [Kordiimonas sp.]